MTKRTVVIRKQSCYKWQPNTKRKIEKPRVVKHNAGFISPVFVVLACTVFSGLFYIYSVNQTAVKGMAIQSAQKQVDAQQKENAALKIKAAQLKSLYNIEDASKNLNMVDSQNVKYIEENAQVAIKNK